MNTKLYNLALGISIDAHDKQTRNDGSPYFYHPFAVSVSLETEREKVLALLHDVIEDTDITPFDLHNQGIPSYIIKDLIILTHTDEDYYDYILNICINGSEEAKWVKYFDIEHNLLTTTNKHKKAKYKLSQHIIMDYIMDNKNLYK